MTFNLEVPERKPSREKLAGTNKNPGTQRDVFKRVEVESSKSTISSHKVTQGALA